MTDRQPMTELPRDWPGPGPIDLAVHDRPHASSTTEWWYVNGHLTLASEQRVSFFVAFFRQVMGRDPQTKAPRYAHSITWAISDLDGKEYVARSVVDKTAPQEGLKRIDRGLGSSDERFNRALREILERGNVPNPDQLFEGDVYINPARLELDYDGDRLTRLDDGRYALCLEDRGRGLGIDIVLEPLKPATRHGQDGVVRGASNEWMFYYTIPRNRVTGHVTYRGLRQEVREGSAWYDHEFGVGKLPFEDDVDMASLAPEQRDELRAARRKKRDETAVGWTWLSTQLDDGSELSIYFLSYVLTGESAGQHSFLLTPEGERVVLEDVSFEALDTWQSSQTFSDYPIRWRVEVPSVDLKLEVQAAYEDQEFITLISKPSFWEGRVEVTGTRAGKAVRGPGFVERSGYTSYEDLDGFFDAVGRMVRARVEAVIPLEPSYEMARDLVASDERDSYMQGLDVEQFARTLIKPIREITDRGGKGWRSYAAITCVDLVGGDSRKFVEWIALPELMHVGSLIVDDVQDKSEVRRGGPTVHRIYGDAQAINAGTAAYFIIHKLLLPDVSPKAKLRLYDLYFEGLRAGHAGQAIDLDGFDHLLPQVVESGDAGLLEQRVLSVHRLKTAAPAGSLARMGAVAGNGTEAQIEGVGVFFEAIGLAFQIVDDVLNLRGFKGDLKAKAEDVMHGKITLPVVKALGRLEQKDRQWLYETLRSKPQDREVVQAVVDMLEGCGAVEACAQQARDVVEDAWGRLAPLVDDSLAKMMLRAFSWYILERHY